MRSEEQELKPCPFCGKSFGVVVQAVQLCGEEIEDDQRSGFSAVVCDASKPKTPDENGCGAMGGFFPDEETAIAAWNARALTSAPGAGEAGAEPAKWRTSQAVKDRLCMAAQVPVSPRDYRNLDKPGNDVQRVVWLSDLQELLQHAGWTAPGAAPHAVGSASDKALNDAYAEGRKDEREEWITMPALARYRFIMALLIDRGVLTNARYPNGVWSLQGIYGIDDSGLRGAGRTAEEAIDNAIAAAKLDPAGKLTHWRETHETLNRNADAEEGTLGFAAIATPSQDLTPGGSGEAAFYLSSQQLPLLGTAQMMYYIPYRMQAEGNFDTPVYFAAPSADVPAVAVQAEPEIQAKGVTGGADQGCAKVAPTARDALRMADMFADGWVPFLAEDTRRVVEVLRAFAARSEPTCNVQPEKCRDCSLMTQCEYPTCVTAHPKPAEPATAQDAVSAPFGRDGENAPEWLRKRAQDIGDNYGTQKGRSKAHKAEIIEAMQDAAILALRSGASTQPADADGEAFRKAAELGLTLRFYGGCAQSSMPGSPSAYEVVMSADRATGMREAVGRAAAVIAKGGESQRLDQSEPEKVLTEHSGCGSGTQVDQVSVRLNPGDKVVLRMGPISAAIAKAAKEQPHDR